jgi:hypothetical protein
MLDMPDSCGFITLPPPSLSADPLSTPAVAAPDRFVGALWHRIAALVLDSIFVGVARMLIALPFFDALFPNAPAPRSRS